MHKVKLDLGARSYYIWIGKDILSDTGRIIADMNLGSCAYVITNKKISSLYGGRLKRSFISAGLEVRFHTVADSEKSKSSATWLKAIKDVADFDRGRGVIIITLGGGVVGDLSGFVASSYRRGVPFIQIPTTLVAQVDSAIGGKVGIDTEFAKNIIGAFYQPKAIFSDISLLKSLPLREMRNGLAEIIKYGVILDKNIFLYLEKNMSKVLNREKSCLEYLVCRCSKLKAEVVSLDEQERGGYRSILNFGHTVGHAIEAASSYSRSISHGEAVAVGMLTAFDIAVSLRLAREKTASRLQDLVKKIGLPIRIKGIKVSKVFDALSYDKKIIKGKARWVLPLDIGHVIICHALPHDLVKKAIIKRIAE